MRMLLAMAVSLLDAGASSADEQHKPLHYQNDKAPDAFSSAGTVVDHAESVSRVGLIRDAKDRPRDLGVTEQDIHGRIVLDAKEALKLERRIVSAHPFRPLVVGGIVGMFLVTIGDMIGRRRRSRAKIDIDHEVEANSVVISPTGLDHGTSSEIKMHPVELERLEPLRHFHPDAPPVKASTTERSRPDYIRVDDAVEVWTPSKVDTARDPVSPARRRRTDPPGADYRFHRLNGDGSVKTAERKRFATDVEATKFAEGIGHGDAVEVWLGQRRLTTIPANYFT